MEWRDGRGLPLAVEGERAPQIYGSYYGDASEGVGGSWAQRVCLGSATSSLHPQLPGASTRSHHKALVFLVHILPSGPSEGVRKTQDERGNEDTRKNQNKTQVQVTQASRVKGQGAAGSWRLY